MANFLVKVNSTYYVRLDVPERFQGHYGKKVFKKSLRTKNLQQAKALSHRYLDEWLIDFQRVQDQWAVETGPAGAVRSKHLPDLAPKMEQWKMDLYEAAQPLLETIRRSTDPASAKAAQEALQQLQADAKAKYGDTPEIASGEWEREYKRALTYKIQNQGKLVAMPQKDPGPISSLIENIVDGKLVPRNDLFRPQLRTKFESYQKDHVESKTHDMRLGALDDVATYFQANRLHLDRAGVVRYLESIKSLAIVTKRRKLSSGKLYFEFLQEEGLIGENTTNPFTGHTLKQRQKEAAKSKRDPFTPAQVENLYAEAIRRKDHPLADCILIAAYTGMRIEELCQLTVDCVENQLLKVADAKTAAGHREVPIHEAISQRIEQLCEASKDNYLIPSTTSNKYEKRSEGHGKRFGRMKTALGYGKKHVFHSIRKTVTTMFEHAGISESVAADVIGHDKPTMTYGLYSGGSSLQQRRAAIDTLHYEFKIA